MTEHTQRIIRLATQIAACWMMAMSGFMIPWLTWWIAAPSVSMICFVAVTHKFGVTARMRILQFALSLPLALYAGTWILYTYLRPDIYFPLGLMEGFGFYLLCALVLYAIVPLVIGLVTQAALNWLARSRGTQLSR